MYTDDTNFNFTDSSDDAVVSNSQNDIAIEKKKQNTTRRKRVVVSKDDAISDLSEYSKNIESCEIKPEEPENKNTELSTIGFVNDNVAFTSDVSVVDSNEGVENGFIAVDNSYVSDSDDLLDKDSQNGLSDVKINIAELKEKTIQELLEIGDSISADVTSAMPKKEIIMNILKTVSFNQGTVIGSGTVEILPDGFGFLRSSDANYITCFSDIYISSNQIRKFNFKVGDVVTGMARAPKRGERYFALQRVVDVNGCGVKLSRYRPNFDDLVPQYPVSRINLEIEGDKNSDISSRVVDLIAPLGKGQRALIVAPPRTGKTVLMQNIAHSIAVNHPEIELIVLLIDERPEEVTDMLRSVKGEVVSSTFDEPATRHVQLADIVIEKAKRMVECGKDVVILLDSLTRLARAYNTVIPSSGKVLTGGVDSNALQRPKRFFGAARNIEQGGSLTIIATALIETGSRMDDVIFEEFKGTGNSEIILDRKIADKRIFPAIDITRSGTRKEELLMDRNVLAKLWVLRRILTQMAPLEAMEFLRDKIKNTKNNHEFFNLMNN